MTSCCHIKYKYGENIDKFTMTMLVYLKKCLLYEVTLLMYSAFGALEVMIGRVRYIE